MTSHGDRAGSAEGRAPSAAAGRRPSSVREWRIEPDEAPRACELDMRRNYANRGDLSRDSIAALGAERSTLEPACLSPSP